MNRAIHAAAAQQRLIGRGHDGNDLLAGDVGQDGLDHCHR
jgi:hypothetical protein